MCFFYTYTENLHQWIAEKAREQEFSETWTT